MVMHVSHTTKNILTREVFISFLLCRLNRYELNIQPKNTSNSQESDFLKRAEFLPDFKHFPNKTKVIKSHLKFCSSSASFQDGNKIPGQEVLESRCMHQHENKTYLFR